MKKTADSRNTEGTAMGKGPALPPRANVVSDFCQEVASTFPLEDSWTDITDRFFEHIEKTDQLLARYRGLEADLGTIRLNQMIGRWIKGYYDLANGEVVPSRRSKLIQAYTTHFRV